MWSHSSDVEHSPGYCASVSRIVPLLNPRSFSASSSRLLFFLEMSVNFSNPCKSAVIVMQMIRAAIIVQSTGQKLVISFLEVHSIRFLNFC